ncbi:carbohydrate ABC transporter permease [Halobellus sp. MBLA0160]|uniref:Carbohydrate ABC transporter permease n=2 Tax=Halobellus ruber TaxID=2761102 RepID=A0A7J9SMH9_9EURY|nr:carbohydrate ABC transporter permease [Halobellus ruber]
MNRLRAGQSDDLEASPRRLALYLMLIALIGIYLLPLETGIVTSLKTEQGYLTTQPLLPPSENFLTFQPWITAWETLSPALINSALYSIPATILSALIGSIAAHGLTNTEWRGQTAVFLVFAIGIFIPYQSVLIPLSRFWGFLELQTMFGPNGIVNLWQLPFVYPHYSYIVELTLTHTAYGIPITTLFFRGYYQALSDDMIEAARLGGAGLLSIYREIVLPLSKPMFVVAFIYQFTSIWNGLLFVLIIVGTNKAARPATLALNELAKVGYVPTYNTMMAGAFITALPTLLVYILFGDQFAKGVAGYGQAD